MDWTCLIDPPEDEAARIALLNKYEPGREEMGAGNLTVWAEDEEGHVMGGCTIFHDPTTDRIYGISIRAGKTVPYTKGDWNAELDALANGGGG